MVLGIYPEQQPHGSGTIAEGMEVRVLNFPENLNHNDLKAFLRPHLNKLSIRAVDYVKMYNKKHASLTFLHLEEGERFLSRHGQARKGPSPRPTPINPGIYLNLKCDGRPIYFEKSPYPPNPIALNTLRREQNERKAAGTKTATRPPKAPSNLPIQFETASVSCGTWTYHGSILCFSAEVNWITRGTAKFGLRSMILQFDNGLRIDFRYSVIDRIISETYPTLSLTIAMQEAPRFYEKISEDPVAELMARLRIQPTPKSPPERQRAGPQRNRVQGLDPKHEKLAGNCLVYRIRLQNNSHIGRQIEFQSTGERLELLKKAHEVPDILYRPINVIAPKEPINDAFKALLAALSSRSLNLPFTLKFQIQRLAQNNFLHPAKVLQLLPEMRGILERNHDNVPICAAVVQRFSTRIPFAGPDTDADKFEIGELIDLLKDIESQVLKEGVPADMSPLGTNSKNVAIIHRVRITPSGTYLQGPSRESKNRVLRKYPDHHEYFIRVEFCEEDGARIMFSPRVSNFKILHQRFKHAMQQQVEIAGRLYEFLGFSHSSLRAQTVWCVSPFHFQGKLLHEHTIIKDLGDFSMIRAPAKHAARIGQVFSDTPVNLHIDPAIVSGKPDIYYGTRIFSDGVGTISKSLLMKVWEKLPATQLLKPTCLQIRYRGAKGMISLDSRLEGDALFLRKSMIKFEGSTSNDLEICESAYKPLPMYLNRQLIKILEDLGVEDSFFLNLQAKEIQRLKEITESPINASSYLKRQSVGTAFHLPWLITKLNMMNLDFKSDAFLRDVLEISRMIELRMLKHKTRIPVEKGWHLHGLMDETSYLKEGEIYCSVVIDGVAQVIVDKNLIVSRAPALHPGDVQLVSAVMPPDGSPLLDLTNCICFSQKGARDLPSQLSGGDLDGDRYYLMYDKNAKLRRTYPPAEYETKPIVELDRPVEKNDVIDHFIRFMETDQLGVIAVAHRITADQKPAGTFDPICIRQAELHSDAVDFSKNGRGVNPADIPRPSRFRPDFEAPGPHVRVEKLSGLTFVDEPFTEPDERNDDDDDFTSYRFYESNKVLGKLYRAIDERKIFEEIQEREARGVACVSNVIEVAWSMIQQECSLIQWEHLKEWAWEKRRMYEGIVSNIMIQQSRHPQRPLSEMEVFVGNILGQTGVPSKQQQEQAKTMKEEFQENSLYVVDSILKDGTDWSKEALERTMACLAVSLEESPFPAHRGQEQIVSFKYLAAALCLREVEFLALPEDPPEWIPGP